MWREKKKQKCVKSVSAFVFTTFQTLKFICVLIAVNSPEMRKIHPFPFCLDWSTSNPALCDVTQGTGNISQVSDDIPRKVLLPHSETTLVLTQEPRVWLSTEGFKQAVLYRFFVCLFLNLEN